MSASEYQREGRDAFLNLRVGSSENCVYVEADHAVTSGKNIAVGFHTQTCDQFTNESERVFEQSEGIFLGAAWFSASAYESSWFIGGFGGHKTKELHTFLGSKSETQVWRNELIGGYQYHFDIAFSLTAGYSFSSEWVLSEETSMAAGENAQTREELRRLTNDRQSEGRFIVLMGWRF